MFCKKTLLVTAVFSIAASLQAQTTVRVTALKASPAKASMYKVTLETDRELDAQAVIAIDFPSSFDLTTVKLAGSNEINGGIRFETAENKLTLKRTGLGKPIPPGREVSVFFGPLKNPGDFEKTEPLQITLITEGLIDSMIKQKVKFE